MKRIGFVDHRLDNFHARTYLALLRGQLAERGFRVVGATAWDHESSRPWADQHEVRYYASVNELAADVDRFIVLAPSDAQLHEEMCRQVLPFRKPTFVDKTFAPDIATAKRIFELADMYGAAVQTTSALRTTDVQRHVAKQSEGVRRLYVWGGGASFDEYGVHPIELVVSCLGSTATDLMQIGSETHPQLVIRFQGERLAFVDLSLGVDVDYSAAITTASSTAFVQVDGSKLFLDAAAAILDFFEAEKPLIDRAETLLIRRIMDLALQPEVRNRFYSLVDVPAPHFRTRAATTTPAVSAGKGRS